MATDVAETTRLAKADAPPPRGRILFGRFYVVYVILGLALAAGVVGVVIAAHANSSRGPSRAWSAWHPTGGGIGLAQQIAAHVGKAYRLGNGHQLDAVIATPPVVTNSTGQKAQVGNVAIRGGKSTGDVVANTSGSSTVIYKLCGFVPPACAVPPGAATTAGARLLRREIVELALYTFHYDSGVHNIIAFMPPTASTKQAVMVFLQRADVASYLDQPLAKTLNTVTPHAATMTPSDKTVVDRLTARRSYSWNFQLQQDGIGIFVLTHLQA